MIFNKLAMVMLVSTALGAPAISAPRGDSAVKDISYDKYATREARGDSAAKDRAYGKYAAKEARGGDSAVKDRAYGKYADDAN